MEVWNRSFTIYIVHFSPSESKFYNCEKLTIWVWCGVANESFTCLQILVYTNRLHGKAAELCLADS